jgi:hypothetical protein
MPQSPKGPIATGFYVKMMLRVLAFEKIRIPCVDLLPGNIHRCKIPHSDAGRSYQESLNEKQCKESESHFDPVKAACFV